MKAKLREKIEGMQQPVAGERYYAVTITADQDGKLHWEAQSVFYGMTDTKPPREQRITCEVFPEKMIDIWRELGQPYIVVTTEEEFPVLVLLGGNALVQVDIAKSKIPFITEPSTVVPDGLFTTQPIEAVPKDQLQRAPTPKRRMGVIKRDNYRCRICGRRAFDYVDIELNVHHIRPWEKGGLTKEHNLITLCRTCHKGLEPHFEWNLYELIDENVILIPDVAETRRQLFEGIKNYRRKIQEILQSMKKSEHANQPDAE